MGAKVRTLKTRLMDRLYQHQRVRRMGAKALRVMRGLFEAYMDDPRQMPPHIVERAVGETTMPRVIADYIAGMTDRFAFEEYAKLFDPFEKV
jgi:dGTPase